MGIVFQGKRWKYLSHLSSVTLDMLDCEKCGSPAVQLVRRIAVNGASQVFWICKACGKAAENNGKAISHSELYKYGVQSLDELEIVRDYREQSEPCAVDGCDNRAVEWHHWAPKHIFPQTAERWPKDYLCIEHHHEWHRKVTPDMGIVDRCPVCGQKVDFVRAIDTDRPGLPENPAFWGQPGERFVKCREGAHFHFRVNGSHRYAYLKRVADGGQGRLI